MFLKKSKACRCGTLGNTVFRDDIADTVEDLAIFFALRQDQIIPVGALLVIQCAEPMIMTGSHDGSVDYLIQRFHTEQAGAYTVTLLGSGRGRSFRSACGIVFALDTAEQIQNLVCRALITVIITVFRNGRCKAGKTGVQFFRIFHFGNDQYDTIRIQRDGFNHQGNILCFEAKFKIGLLHHITEQRFSFFCAVGKFTYF